MTCTSRSSVTSRSILFKNAMKSAAVWALRRSVMTLPVACGVRILRRPRAPGGYDRLMLLFLVYRLVCWLLHLALVRSPAARTETVELLALRHEVRVLRRQVKCSIR